MTTTQLADRSLAIETGLLIALVCAARLIGVGIAHLPVGDEMFHVLSAQSWAQDGTFRIADGVYDRASFFTAMVGAMFRLFGESLVAARIPALVFGVVWVVVLFVWVRANAGRLAAWIAAGLFCIAPHAIELSLYSRMYTLHGAAFLLGVVMVYAVIAHSYTLATKAACAALALACFGLAFHLHLVTYPALAALAVAIGMDIVTRHHRVWTARQNRLWVIALLFAMIAAAAALAVIAWDTVVASVERFLLPAYANRGADIRYYQKMFMTDYPALWPLLPLVLILAISYRPRFGVFCAALFISAFLLQSIAGRKEERYIYYSMPFLFALWGMALAALAPHLDRLLSDIANRFTSDYLQVKQNQGLNTALKTTCAVAIVGFILVSSGSFFRTVNIWRGQSYYFGTQLSDWEKAKPVLQPLVDRAPTVVTTNFAKSQYHFGRFDIVFSKVVAVDVLGAQAHGSAEFAADPRTGRPVISTVASLQQIFEQYPGGLFVGEKSEWRNRFRMSDEGADFLESRAVRVELPPGSRLVAFSW